MREAFVEHALFLRGGLARSSAALRRPRAQRKLAAWLIPVFILVLGIRIAAHVRAGNFFEVVSGVVYRSAQPSPEQIRRWHREHQFACILNLRGEDSPFAQQEQEVADELGVELIHLRLAAYYEFSQQQLIDLLEVFESAPRPLLLHCRQGMDRSGTVSALAGWLIGGQSYERAKWHAFVVPGPWKHKKGPQHISDIFGDYERYCRENNLVPDDRGQFMNWARTIYRPRYYHARLETTAPVRALPGRPVAITVNVTNLSAMPIPAGRADRAFCLASQILTDPSEATLRSRPDECAVELPKRDLLPDEMISVVLAQRVPNKPGDYFLLLDLKEEKVTTFRRRGSTPLLVSFHVSPDAVIWNNGVVPVVDSEQGAVVSP